MVPIYASLSCLSLGVPSEDIVFDSIRDCYEAFTIYSFFQLLLEYIGGESVVGAHFREKGIEPHPWPFRYCLPDCKLDGRFLRKMKQGVLQFVFLKPLMALVTIVLEALDMYGKDEWVTTKGFLYIQIVYNISYSWALYALALFYGATCELLVKHHPVKKFVMVKMIVFMSFWQGFTISLLLNCGVIATDHAAADIQAFLICVEMAAAAFLHMAVASLSLAELRAWKQAFPVSEYSELDKMDTTLSRSSNLADCVNVQDVMQDAINNFTPSYRQYECQSQGESTKPAFLQRSFVLKEEPDEGSAGGEGTLGLASKMVLGHEHEHEVGQELVDINPFAAHSCMDDDPELGQRSNLETSPHQIEGHGV